MKAGTPNDSTQYDVTQTDLQAIQQRRVEEADYQKRVAQDALDHAVDMGPTLAAAFEGLKTLLKR
ncbi:hypothetical protein [Pseudorhodobacter ferrugineus]|uniref:hypothetical protein n=1 Tax=Pseudorhodobacter ferrugineus TaxID=77008 RepID=UPI0004109165|nr:hypothetical protein [Pseudorhodobacter ferrugineus]